MGRSRSSNVIVRTDSDAVNAWLVLVGTRQACTHSVRARGFHETQVVLMNKTIWRAGHILSMLGDIEAA